MNQNPEFCKHAPEACPRCGKLFTCKVNSILKYDCLNIRLDRAETEYIRALAEWQFDGGCLCSTCLHALQAEYHSLLNPPFRV